MRLLLSGKWFLLLFFSACLPNITGPAGGGAHCSQYSYSESKGAWTDASGKRVNCTIVDRQRIYNYMPSQGCEYWQKFFAGDATVKFVEVPIKSGSGQNTLTQKYCVKQRYVSLDHSGQVMLIDEGIFCFREHSSKDGYIYSSCDGVQRKAAEKSQ